MSDKTVSIIRFAVSTVSTASETLRTNFNIICRKLLEGKTALLKLL